MSVIIHKLDGVQFVHEALRPKCTIINGIAAKNDRGGSLSAGEWEWDKRGYRPAYFCDPDRHVVVFQAGREEDCGWGMSVG